MSQSVIQLKGFAFFPMRVFSCPPFDGGRNKIEEGQQIFVCTNCCVNRLLRFIYFTLSSGSGLAKREWSFAPISVREPSVAFGEVVAPEGDGGEINFHNWFFSS